MVQIIYNGGPSQELGYGVKGFIIQSEDDLAVLAKWPCLAGSWALNPAEGKKYIKDLNGVWNSKSASDYSGSSSADMSNYYTKEEVDKMNKGHYVIKGSFTSLAEAPKTAQIGDVYNDISTGMNYVYTENGWDALGTEMPDMLEDEEVRRILEGE